MPHKQDENEVDKIGSIFQEDLASETEFGADWAKAEEILISEKTAEGIIIDYNKGGLIVKFGNIRAFIPSSQISQRRRQRSKGETPEEKWAEMVGENVRFRIVETDPTRHRLILSERAAEKETQENQEEKFLEVAPKQRTIVLNNSDGVDQALTSHYLRIVISPYLDALEELQRVIDEIDKQPHRKTTIKEIRQHSPISVSLDGAAGAIQLVQENVVSWRRRHAEIMAHFLEQEKLADIESKKAEILEKRAHAAKDRAEAKKFEVDVEKQHEEIEKMKLENERIRIELQRAKIQLALDMLAHISPNMQEVDKIAYVVKLLPPLDILAFSDVEITGNDN